MRALSPLSVASLVLLAASLGASGAHAQGPMRKPGLWEMKMQMSAPMAMTMTSRQCTDASQEKGGAMFRNQQQNASGIDCKAGVPLPAPGGGWSYSSTCTMRNMTMSTSGTVKGDFNSGYHMESTTHMSPAPVPQMAETHMIMDAKWLGPCPADMKPGEVEVNGRKFSPRGG